MLREHIQRFFERSHNPNFAHDSMRENVRHQQDDGICLAIDNGERWSKLVFFSPQCNKVANLQWEFVEMCKIKDLPDWVDECFSHLTAMLIVGAQFFNGYIAADACDENTSGNKPFRMNGHTMNLQSCIYAILTH